jgi:hypothetical protein
MNYQSDDLVIDTNYQKFRILYIKQSVLVLKKETKNHNEELEHSNFTNNLFWEQLTKEITLPKSRIIFNLSQFRRTYLADTSSSHCRSSNEVKHIFSKNLEKNVLDNLDSYLKMDFTNLFYCLSNLFLKPFHQGGGKLRISSTPKYPLTFPKGTTSLGVLVCYDYTINFMRCGSKNISSKVYLIKDDTKGPWNFCVSVLNFKEGKEIKKVSFQEENDFTRRVYYVEKEKIINKLNLTNSPFYDPQLDRLDGDRIESYTCSCWNAYQKMLADPNYCFDYKF